MNYKQSLFKRFKLYCHFLGSMLKVNYGLLVGMWKLTKLPQPAISVFGGTKLDVKSEHSKKISALTKKLADKGFSIITGGGPGVMEAANLGAIEATLKKGEYLKEETARDVRRKIVSMGIGVKDLDQKPNKYLQESIILPYFFTRKWLLVRYSVGFVVAPGGFGTLDELAEIISLIQTHSMPHTPIVLIGKEYWAPLFEWINNRAFRDKLIEDHDLKILSVTDDVDEAYEIIIRECWGGGVCALDAPSRE